MKHNIGDVLIDEDGCRGIVCVKWDNGDLSSFENNGTYVSDVDIKFAGDKDNYEPKHETKGRDVGDKTMNTFELRAAAKVVYYLDTDERVADNLSELLNNAADKIEELENEKDSYHKEYQKGFEDGCIDGYNKRKSNDSFHAFNRGFLKGLKKNKKDVEKAVIE